MATGGTVFHRFIAELTEHGTAATSQAGSGT